MILVIVALFSAQAAHATPSCTGSTAPFNHAGFANSDFGVNLETYLSATIHPVSWGNTTGSNCSTTQFCHVDEWVAVINRLSGGGSEWIQTGYQKNSFNWNQKSRYVEIVTFTGTDPTSSTQTDMAEFIRNPYNTLDYYDYTFEPITTTNTSGHFKIVHNSNATWTAKYAAAGTPTTFGVTHDTVTFNSAPDASEIQAETANSVDGKCLLNYGVFSDYSEELYFSIGGFWGPEEEANEDYPLTLETDGVTQNAFTVYTDGYPH